MNKRRAYRMLSALVIGVVTGAFSVSGATASSASSAGAAQSDEAIEILELYRPDVLVESVPSTFDVAARRDEVWISPGSDLRGADRDETQAGSTQIGVPTFHVKTASRVDVSGIPGILRLEAERRDSEFLIQQTYMGIRVISSTFAADGPDAFAYDVDVSAGARLSAEGSLVFLEDDSGVLAVLEKPWAIDAAGRPVDTWFSWDDGVLTQHLDLADASAFPVVADLAWTYTYSFSTGKTPAKAESLLRSCFNCYFPIPGAPKAFPAYNQLLPLHILLISFECRMGPVLNISGQYFQYSFAATKNHIDGVGSTIIFLFRSDKKLYVTGRVQSAWMNNWFYTGGALMYWSAFGRNIANAA